MGGLSLPAGARTSPAVGHGTVTVTTSGTAKVTLTVRFTVNGAVRATETLTLKGATRYTQAVSHDLGARPCSGTWGITASTDPDSGAHAGTAAVPACPTAVTGLDVTAFTVTGAKTAAATVRVTADGPGLVRLIGEFSAPNGATGRQDVGLSGKTSYTRTLSFAFPQRVCGQKVAFTASTDPAAPGGAVTRSVAVDCPAAVTSVTVKGLARTGTAATATVAVVTANAKQVRLTLTWLLAGKAAGTQTVTLSGKTSYTVTQTFAYPRLPCATAWGVRAATVPAAPGGASTLTKKTAACGTAGA
ncbi:hypothetical protein GCM10009530_46270 [Microbispora corallina]